MVKRFNINHKEFTRKKQNKNLQIELSFGRAPAQFKYSFFVFSFLCRRHPQLALLVASHQEAIFPGHRRHEIPPESLAVVVPCY